MPPAAGALAPDPIWGAGGILACVSRALDVSEEGMRFAFDPEKDRLNIARHGLSLAFGARIFDDAMHLVLPSFREEDGEGRWKAIGEVDGRLYTAVHVWRGEVIRYISVRRSNAGEDRLYRGAASRPE